MDPHFIRYLYAGSPLSVSISTESADRILTNIKIGKVYPAVAIAYELSAVGVIQNEIHQQNLDLLRDLLGSTEENIDYFMLGFISAPALIIGASIFDRHSPKETFKYLCPPTDDQILILHNAYKSRLLLPALRFFQSSPLREPMKAAQPIYNLCKITGFTSDEYFSTGVAASEDLYTQYTQLLGYP